LVAASGDLIVALPGSHGTRSEISIALKLGRPVIGVRAWGEIVGVRQVNSIEELKKELVPFF
jgi:predicted Rossmann-fold nucleotide-binding protein